MHKESRTLRGRRRLRHIRSEARICSGVILALTDTWYGRTDESPTQAPRTPTQAAIAMFFIAAMCVALLERWSPIALRYLSLVLPAPSALLYFGYPKLGYLPLAQRGDVSLLADALQTGGRALRPRVH